jgi:hypothetical protein
LLERLAHRLHVLEANGESYRLRQSRQQHKVRLKPKDEIVDSPHQAGV